MPVLRRLIPACGLLLLATAFAAADVQRDAIPSQDDLARHGLVRAWWNRAVFNPARDKIRWISADEQAVFVQSTGGMITAFDSETGRRMWSKLIGTPDQVAYPLSTNDRMAFLAAGMNLYGIDKASGETIWSIKLPHHPSAAPEVDEDQVYIGTAEGSVYAYNLAKIKSYYDRRLLPQYQLQTLDWRYQAPSEIVTPPVSNGEAVVFASYSGLLYSVFAKDRGLNFQFETEGRAPIRVPLGRSQDTVFVASDDARVFALDMMSGNRRWSFTAGQPVRQQPRVVGNSVFVMPSGRGMYALRTTTGFEQWHQPQAVQFLAATPELTFASDKTNNVLIVDRKDGAITASLPYRHLNVRVENERTDRLYLANDTGLVVCIREASREEPIWHMFPDRQPIRAEVAPDEPVDPAAGMEPSAADAGVEPAAEANPFANP
jgi:outer membrane protein assembly factor BamB